MAQIFSDVCKDRSALGELGGSASDVTRALNELLNHVKDAHADRIPDIMEQIMTASGELIASYDSGEMVRQARILAQSTAELIQAIKGEAESQSDSELQVSKNGQLPEADHSPAHSKYPPFWTDDTLHQLQKFQADFGGSNLTELDWQYPENNIGGLRSCSHSEERSFVRFGSLRSSFYENA